MLYCFEQVVLSAIDYGLFLYRLELGLLSFRLFVLSDLAQTKTALLASCFIVRCDILTDSQLSLLKGL